MGAFAGWDMPLYYSTARAEHTAVRKSAGVFDVSHMGQLEVSGPGAREGLALTLTNDLDIAPGQGQYTLMCEDDGGVIDDLIVYALGDRYLLVVNASNIAACRDRLADRLPADAELTDRSPETAMLALQGPAWADALRPLSARGTAFGLEYFSIGDDEIAGVPCRIARTGYTGEPGVELMCPWDDAPAVWDALLATPAAPAPAGLVARDTLRLEMGYPLYGQELSRERTPIEAGLKWACDVEDGRFFGVGHAAPPGGGGDVRAARHLPPDRAGHPPPRAGRGDRRAARGYGHQRYPLAVARRRHRDGLRPVRAGDARQRPCHRCAREAEGRPHRPPPARGDIPEGMKETPWLLRRPTPPTSGTTPSTTG